MSRTHDEYVEANREAWNSSAPHHRGSAQFASLLQDFARPGYSCLDEILTQRLRRHGVAGADVVQLCCNNGRELLSVRNLGASSCVGFDQSAAFLEQARELAAAGGLDCDFVESDIYAISERYDRSFDIALVTIGVFGWLPDLGRFFHVAARLLRPGGKLLVYEQHPIMNMFEPAGKADPFRPEHSYFRAEPFEDQGAIVYDGTTGLDGATQYWFVHPMSDIVSECIAAGFAVEEFREFAHNISSAEFDVYDNRAAQLPQSYILVAGTR